MKGKPLFLFMFLLFSALLSGYVLLFDQVPGSKVSRHSFEPSPVSLVLLSALIFILLLAVAIVYLKVVQVKRWSETKAPFWQAWVRKFTALSPRKKIIVLFLGSLLAFNAGTLLLVSGEGTFSGDEPHYLLICPSLLRDGECDL